MHIISSVSLVSLLFSTISAAVVCQGKKKLDPSGKYCYVIYNGRMGFHDAEKVCFDDNGYHLVSVHNMIDNNFLYNISSDLWANYIWLGLTDMTADGSWHWIDGSNYQFQNWAPDSGKGSCGAMRISDGRWMAQDCTQAYQFFCYGQAQGAPTDPSSHKDMGSI